MTTIQQNSGIKRAKNINVDTGVVVFDDIKDCDVNVTYDLIDGEFPPPNISGMLSKITTISVVSAIFLKDLLFGNIVPKNVCSFIV